MIARKGQANGDAVMLRMRRYPSTADAQAVWQDLSSIDNPQVDKETDEGSVRFAEKTSRNIVPADLLWGENIVPAKKNKLKSTDYKTSKHGHNVNEMSFIVCLKLIWSKIWLDGLIEWR